MADNQYDLVVIGGGPGGYVAAIRAAQLGMRVACVEKRDSLGGTCLNIGCIPSKALLHSSEKYAEATHALAAHGVKLSGVALDLPAMMARKEKVVSDLTKGVEFLFRKNKVEWIRGAGRIAAPDRVEVASGNGQAASVTTKAILIATGSDVMKLTGVEIDEQQIVSSTGALSLPRVPERLAVVGGGYIGLEMGSVWGRLGAKVTVIEFLDRILPGMDGELGKQFQRILTRQGFAFRLGTKVAAARRSGGRVSLTMEPANGGTAETLEADVVLVAIGRRPCTEGLGLEALGVALDNSGRIRVDRHFCTDRKSTRLNSSHSRASRMPSSA